MALPLVKSALACSDFTRTVQPYIPQLNDLPQQLWQSSTNPQALKQLYLNTNPLISAFAFSLFLVPIVLVISEVNKNYSQIDRVWSLLPTVYNLHYVAYAHAKGLPTQRLDSLAIISSVWSMRLTFNYWRKGGYEIGSEDYRWEVLRKYINNAPLFFLFNVVFISLSQSVLLFSVSMPTYILLLASPLVPSDNVDILFTQVLLASVFLAFTADQQQWNFQSAKHTYQRTAKVPHPTSFTALDFDRGFRTTGLWALSRHPNFLAEQTTWVTLYTWSCYITGDFWNWTGVGALSYLVLFQASTWFTELLTERKYPEYKKYQQRVGKFVPKLWGEGIGDLRGERGEGKKEK
ncbi:MAG: hypothetical protein LQ350_001343 [Teloschistes chrysophthalmus]|nr:MAG: hypothetical protein LQ350_001343 [Niorma chrysophthalma]